MKIKELVLYTPALTPILKFYSDILDLEVVAQSVVSISFRLGDSILKFIQRERFTPYHFAINIPSNQAEAALQWLKQRVEILKDGDNEIQYFDFWDAYAIYFYDPDHNIVEFIARKRLNKIDHTPFASSSILGISEIGLPTTDISREYDLLNRVTGLPIYSGSIERFCAAGDDEGLFILINKQIKKEWYPTEDVPYSSDFVITFEEDNLLYCFDYHDGLLTEQTKRF